HRHILPFLGTLDTNMYTILVSAFMEKGSMMEYIEANPAARKEPLIVQIAEAVSHLHRLLGLVHGDLKCQNVLISDDGNALLADFGLSTTVEKQAGDGPTATAIRASNTLRFAAPELLKDDARSPSRMIRSKTTETDVFAFGMLMIQASTIRVARLGLRLIVPGVHQH
ncbi:kinase-like protein, partial [Auricularia subglabra TFB-10046 SS5]